MKKIIKTLPAEGGQVGYTDFKAIYINQNLIKSERLLVEKHELSHIWLDHNLRGLQFKKNNPDADHLLLNLAMDYEIAKHIYDDDDDLVLLRENSLLFGGVKKSDCNKYPACTFFDEFYLELKKAAKKNAKSWDAKSNEFDENANCKKAKTARAAVDEAKKKAEALKKSQNIQKAQEKLKKYKMKPSLASVIDSVAGRQKVERIKSYRRPSRVEHPGFFKKGAVSKRKTPKISVYVDRSGSFDVDKTRKATDTLSKILMKYRGQVDKDVLYFNDTIHIKDPKVGQGGTNHQIVIDEILKTNSELSIIITDDDYGIVEKPHKLPRTVVVPVGCSNTIIADKLGLLEMSV